MMEKIIFATQNEHKLMEIRMIMKDLPYEIISMKEAGIDIDIVEDGETFWENALIKAQAISKFSHHIVMADDSGLEIDFLNKEPGVYSARYLGVDTPYPIKNQMIIDRLEGVKEEERSARFVCEIATVFPSGEVLQARGTIEGRIDHEIKGVNGFGYDPIFYVPELGCTTAEMPAELKNLHSHRGKALREMAKKLGEVLGHV